MPEPTSEVDDGARGTHPPPPGSHRQAHGWQRAENALIAAGIVIAVIAWGQPWWPLLAAFLAFDLSALGYLVDQRVGAFAYNVVHNYSAPAALLMGWTALQLGGTEAHWLVMLAACWGFHVAVDRALGYGLKLGPFAQTHLGAIGGASHHSIQHSRPGQPSRGSR